MNHEEMSKYRAFFESAREKALFSANFVNEDLCLRKEDLVDESDQTSAELENSMRIRLRNREALYLKKIDGALRRIQEGVFGSCDGCGEEIEPKRLEARPTATLCLACKEEQERGEHAHADGRRPKSLGIRLVAI